MSIDGIGRPPRPPNGAEPVGGPAAAGGAEPFEIKRSAETQALAPTGLLAELERGALSLDQYLDARVEDALAPLAQRLAPEQVEFMRSSLRAELASDPVLVELVRRVTGAVPATTEP